MSTAHIKNLLRTFPEFENSSYYKDSDDRKSEYTVFYDFSTYLISMIESEKKLDQSFISKVFSYLNNGLNGEDFDLSNLIGVGILEYLSESPKACTLLKSGLQGDAQRVFEEILDESKPGH